MPENDLSISLKDRLLRLLPLLTMDPVAAAGVGIYAGLKDPNLRNQLWDTTKHVAGFIAPAGVESSLQQAAAETVIPWYSTLRRVAEERLPNLFEGQQAKNTLRKGVTQAEWEKSGLENRLALGQKYSKSQVLSQIDESTPELKDVVLSDNPGEWERGVMEARNLSEIPVHNPPKFSSLVEPGGRNYKEMFVTAPRPVYSQEAGNWDRAIHARSWRDGHLNYSDIENPIVRLRFNTRIDSEGKKVLFLEEMQPPNPENQAKMPPELLKRWREIGMKRAIKYAADNGYDRVAWTTGEMQANRYDISKRVDRLHYSLSPAYAEAGETEPSFVVAAFKDGEGVWSGSIPQSKLDSYFPKEVADRMRAGAGRKPPQSWQASPNSRVLSGLDLQVGGEGLKRVYDQDLPNVAKKVGAKIGTTKIQFNRNYQEGTELARIWNNMPAQEVPSIDITPEMRTKAKGGFPIYDLSPIDLGAALLSNYVLNRKENQ